jgi:hypothetical protein
LLQVTRLGPRRRRVSRAALACVRGAVAASSGTHMQGRKSPVISVKAAKHLDAWKIVLPYHEVNQYHQTNLFF